MNREVLDVLILVAATLACSLALLAVVGYVGKKPWMRLRKLSAVVPVSDLKSQTFQTATIVESMGPLMDAFLGSGSTLYVTGGDGFPVGKKKYPWITLLTTWLTRNCTIFYFLIDPKPQAVLRLQELARQHSGLHLCIVPPAVKATNQEDAALLSRLRTFHPVLAQSGRERVMWLEGYHPPDSTVAYSCDFVAPDDARFDDRYDYYLDKLKYIRSQYCAIS